MGIPTVRAAATRQPEDAPQILEAPWTRCGARSRRQLAAPRWYMLLKPQPAKEMFHSSSRSNIFSELLHQLKQTHSSLGVQQVHLASRQDSYETGSIRMGSASSWLRSAIAQLRGASNVTSDVGSDATFRIHPTARPKPQPLGASPTPGAGLPVGVRGGVRCMRSKCLVVFVSQSRRARPEEEGASPGVSGRPSGSSALWVKRSRPNERLVLLRSDDDSLEEENRKRHNEETRIRLRREGGTARLCLPVAVRHLVLPGPSVRVSGRAVEPAHVPRHVKEKSRKTIQSARVHVGE
ncbi:hypothetical protein EYF80_048031 [Liparis tanakae]|uniref:Uncharacterized protein n=1 Tax=Liparis tanakae TaxID=230148 RepID=A0A4Z2FKL3_9TELE|nr:hypothetical protein EYF80_048031 [Liparis tanakae]